MKKYCLILYLCFLITAPSCRDSMKEDAEIIVNRMSTEQKIGQMLMVGIPGNKISSRSKRIIEKYLLNFFFWDHDNGRILPRRSRSRLVTPVFLKG